MGSLAEGEAGAVLGAAVTTVAAAVVAGAVVGVVVTTSGATVDAGVELVAELTAMGFEKVCPYAPVNK